MSTYDPSSKIIYLRNASSNKKLLDIKGVLRKIFAYELKDANGKSYHLYNNDYASQIVDDVEAVVISAFVGEGLS
jgi:hypothetical protein